VAGGRIAIGGQTAQPGPRAYCAEMSKDAGAVSVIVGHSERRQQNGETDGTGRRKQSRMACRLLTIISIGETHAALKNSGGMKQSGASGANDAKKMNEAGQKGSSK
jgi:triosephosphate isomerase (TIM)